MKAQRSLQGELKIHVRRLGFSQITIYTIKLQWIINFPVIYLLKYNKYNKIILYETF